MGSAARSRPNGRAIGFDLVHDGPVQEHVVWRAPRYTDSGGSINPPPLAPMVLDWPYEIASGPRLDQLLDTAEAIAEISMDRLAVATRRYILARAERTRATDQIVDYVIAIEAITGVGGGPARGAALADLIARSPSDADEVEAEHKRLTDRRNAIIHNGASPSGARKVAAGGRALVSRALNAQVRHELGGQSAEAAGLTSGVS